MYIDKSGVCSGCSVSCDHFWYEPLLWNRERSRSLDRLLIWHRWRKSFCVFLLTIWSLTPRFRFPRADTFRDRTQGGQSIQTKTHFWWCDCTTIECSPDLINENLQNLWSRSGRIKKSFGFNEDGAEEDMWLLQDLWRLLFVDLKP